MANAIPNGALIGCSPKRCCAREGGERGVDLQEKRPGNTTAPTFFCLSSFLTQYFYLYAAAARNLTGTASEITTATMKVRRRLTTITAPVGRSKIDDATRPTTYPIRPTA